MDIQRSGVFLELTLEGTNGWDKEGCAGSGLRAITNFPEPVECAAPCYLWTFCNSYMSV